MQSPRAPKRRFTQLTFDERMMLRRLLTQKHRVREIAATLGKDRSTIFREIRRNTNALGIYDPHHATGFLRKRRIAARSKFRIIENDPQLETRIENLLKEQHLSPEQIVGYMERGLNLRRVCHKTIYNWIERDWQGRKTYLRHKGRPRFAFGERKRAWQKDKRHISERPKIVEKRARAGDWEGDLVHGSKDDSRHALLTLVDRKAGVVVGHKVQTLKPHLMAHIVKIALAGRPVHTLTFDNGIEFAHHKTMEKLIGCKVYFTDVNSPQQRGSNENTNGLLREFFPKGQSLRHVTQEQVDRVCDLLNSRPRKRLGYRAPRDVFAELTGLSRYRLRKRH